LQGFFNKVSIDGLPIF